MYDEFFVKISLSAVRNFQKGGSYIKSFYSFEMDGLTIYFDLVIAFKFVFGKMRI